MFYAHSKHIIHSERQFDFLKDLVASVPDLAAGEDDAEMIPGLAGVASDIQHPTESLSHPPDEEEPGPSIPPIRKPTNTKPEGPKKRGRWVLYSVVNQWEATPCLSSYNIYNC